MFAFSFSISVCGSLVCRAVAQIALRAIRILVPVRLLAFVQQLRFPLCLHYISRVCLVFVMAVPLVHQAWFDVLVTVVPQRNLSWLVLLFALCIVVALRSIRINSTCAVTSICTTFAVSVVFTLQFTCVLCS